MRGASDSAEQIKRRIDHEYAIFRGIVDRSKEYLARQRYEAAVIYAGLAASYAELHHPGIFVSPEIERILLTIGHSLDVPQQHSLRDRSARRQAPERILHVATRVRHVGGHSIRMRRWINQDSNRSHSVVLTRQRDLPLPQALTEAIANSGGSVTRLDEGQGSAIGRARQLRQIATQFDLVVLHTAASDPVPLLALADKRHTPPVIFAEHADHTFWLGIGVSDVVTSFRHSGWRLAQGRRHVASERSSLLPLVLDPAERMMSRAEAKRQLGLAEDNIVLLSVGRPHKYVSRGTLSFFESLIPVLERYAHAVLLAVGPDFVGEWAEASQRTQGRVKAFGQRADTALFFQAADIYVDSFPNVSVTSLLEAGYYATPLVSRSAFSPECGILTADAPGLTNCLMRAWSAQEYSATISSLIESEALRREQGEKARQAVAGAHSSERWQQALEATYAQATTLPPVTLNPELMDQKATTELDIAWSYVYRHEFDPNLLTLHAIRALPFDLRVRSWIELLVKHRLFRPKFLLPEWCAPPLKRLAPRP